jgi:glucose/mannose-6-phosphate isomerase
VAISHSGGTEETLSEAGEAIRRGCKLLAITTGGVLGPEARQAGAPVFSFEYPYPPRAALGYLFVPLVAFFSRLGFLRDRQAQMDEAIGVLTELQPQLAVDSATSRNEAKRLARTIEGRMPVIYGGGIMAEVAHRWKTQFNENSKAWAAYEVFPELNHNAVVGYERPRDFLDHAMVLLLESSHEHPRVAVRSQVTARLMEQRGVKFEKVGACGDSDLAQMLSAILLGDYVSYYLAQLYQVDPTPIEAINYLKEELAKAAA